MQNKKFVDCFMLMGATLALKGGEKLPAMNRPLIQDTNFVNISFSIQELYISDVKNMNLEITGILNQKWTDPRLSTTYITRKKAVKSQIWKPKITNTLGTKSKSCADDDNTVFWRGYGLEGDVILTEKMTIATQCTTDFDAFPFDSQVCELRFGSYRFTADEVSLIWDYLAVEVYRSKISNEFSLINVTTYMDYDLRISGNFSVAVIKLNIKRENLHYIICTILPSFFVTFLNYFSLWLEVTNRSTRVNINIFSFAVQLTFFFISTCITQPVPYLKALDIFTGTNLCFSFLSMLQTFIVDSFCNAEEFIYNIKKKGCKLEYPKSVYWSDLLVKILVPIFYTFFVCLYGNLYVK